MQRPRARLVTVLSGARWGGRVRLARGYATPAAVEWSMHLLTGANLQHDVAAGLIGAAFAGWLAAAPRKDS